MRNDTPFDLEFYNAVDASPEFIAINSADLPFSIKPGETANFAYRGGGIVEIIKTGGSGGSASFPETGSNADVLVKDSAVDGGVKWSNRLTTAETSITDLSLNQIEITTTASITTNTLGTITNKPQHMRSVLVKNGVNTINITLEASSNAKFEAIYYKKGSGAITFVAGAGVTLVKVANDGILNGDYVVVKEQRSAYNGDIVVAVLKNGFATLKRFYREASRIRLQPANSSMSPIYVTDVEIRGKVVAVIRQFNN